MRSALGGPINRRCVGVEPKQVRSLDASTSGLLNPKRQEARRPCGSVDDFGQMSATDTETVGQLSDGLLEGMGMPCHVTSVVCATIKSRGNEIVPVSIPSDPIGVNTWPQRPAIQRAVLAFRKERGLSPEQMAGILEVAPSYLHNLLYDKRVWPSLEVAQKLAEILGMKLGDVVDDPGAEITGATAASSDLDRFMLRTMGSNLSKLTDAQKQAAFEAWNAIIRGYEK